MTIRGLVVGITVMLATASTGSHPARADGGPLGAGVAIGSATGLVAKLYLSRSHALDAGFGTALVGERGVTVYVDYLWHPFLVTAQPGFTMPVYLGVGGRILDHEHGNGTPDDTHFGVRFPAGFLFDFKTLPMDAFLEVALIVDVIDNEPPDNRELIDVNAALGVRYYF